jgi:hypothetical protein
MKRILLLLPVLVVLLVLASPSQASAGVRIGVVIGAPVVYGPPVYAYPPPPPVVYYRPYPYAYAPGYVYPSRAYYNGYYRNRERDEHWRHEDRDRHERFDRDRHER